jgi:hypothetical protein
LLLVTSEASLVVSCDDCQLFGPTEKKPDFLFLASKERPLKYTWGVVDMKGRIGKVDSTVQQLQAGADKIASHQGFGRGVGVSALLPIVIYNGKSRAADHLAYRGKKVRFQERSFTVVVKRMYSGLKIEDCGF